MTSSASRPGHADRAAQMESFRAVRNMAAGKGTHWENAETTVFTLVAAIAAWSLISLLVVLAQTARG